MSIKNLTDEQLEIELKMEEQRNALLADFASYRGEDRVVPVEEARQYLDALPKSFKVNTSIKSLDKLTDGFQMGELVIISGPTGMGKTTLCQTLTHNFSKQNITSLWFSFEVGAGDLIKRYADDLPNFVLPLKVEGSSLSWIESKIWEGIAKYKVKAVFIDHLHYLVGFKDLQSGNSSFVIGGILRELKQLALRTGTTIFLVSHITKIDSTKEPDLNDLRDSSFTSQEADHVLMVWRLKQNGEYIKNSIVKVDKSRRTGNLGKVKLFYEKGRFYEELSGL